MTTGPPLRRGDIVLVHFPFASGAGSKKRPALVVQADALNALRANVILASITSKTVRANLPSHHLIDLGTPEGRSSGLHASSLVDCSTLMTVERSLVVQVIGSLPPTTMARIDACLKAALDLP